MSCMNQYLLTHYLGRASRLDTTRLPKNLISDVDKFNSMWNNPITELNFICKNLMEIPELIQPYMEWVNSLGYGEFNSVSIGYHVNEEKSTEYQTYDMRKLRKKSPIVLINLTIPDEKRKFKIRDRISRNVVKSVDMKNGSVLIMCDEFQTEYRHEIEQNIDEKRISIVFKQYL